MDARTRPYPPSLRRIAARIIDPATGASTCAFGSHKWTEYIGILTRKARIVISHQIDAVVAVIGLVIWKKINSDLFQELINMMDMSRGSEAVTVYISK